jgi:hypothetical protein
LKKGYIPKISFLGCLEVPKFNHIVVVWCGGGVVVVWWGCGGGVVVFFTDYNTTPTKVVLSCFGLLVGLWQFCKCHILMRGMMLTITEIGG